MEFLSEYHWEAVITIIPKITPNLSIPISSELKCWWIFLILGIAGVVASLSIENVIIASLLGVFAFSSFWTIKEVFEQEERVKKGWFPKNPKRKYKF